MLSEKNLSTYITGLIEADGTIFVPKTVRSAKNKLIYPSIQIPFHLKDFPLASLIQQRLGVGSLARKKGVNAYVLTICCRKGIYLLTSMLNGNMRTPKLIKLSELINWININYTPHELLVPQLFPFRSSLFTDAWFSGFIDGGASFQVRATLNKFKVECKFELTQSQKFLNLYDTSLFLNHIAVYLHTTVKPIRLDRRYPEYRVRTVNLNGNEILKNYLSKFPLFTSKYLDYLDWLNALEYFKLKKGDRLSFLPTILNIKSRMNDRRKKFNWDHLQKFYNLD